MKQTPRPHGSRAALLLAIAATALAAISSPAAAAPADGEVKLTFKAGAKSSLLRQGVKVDGGRGRTQVASLSVKRAWSGNPDRVRAAGAITLASGKRVAKLRGVLLTIGARRAAISAKLGKKRLVFFRARGSRRAVGSTLLLRSRGLRLTGKGARLLRKRLGLGRGLAGRVGLLVVRAEIKAPAAPIVAPPTPDPTPDPKVAYPYEAECPVPFVEGSEGFSDAPGEVGGTAAAPIFNPGTSQEVTGTTVEWGFKASFRNYVAFVPPAGSLQAVEGAGANPSEELMALPEAFFDFPVATGTYEPGTAPDHSDDLLVADGSGAALFCKPDHGFNVVLKNPTVTIDGEDSRITADVGVNLNGVWHPFQRADVASLDLEGVEPEIADSGNTLTWEDVPASFTAAAEVATGGLYEAGEALDPVTVSTSLNRPLLAQCGIEAGSPETLPAVEFGLDPLPTLDEPVSGSGGTIDWGFRRASRNSITMFGGSFPLLGGATEGYPGNMGGSASAPPAGGEGKFFRFPIDHYEYDAGEAGGADDRLIATSEATVGFCLPAHTYGMVISKPTLIIDGAESRLIANAYSLQAGNGWIGGRVDLVDLNQGALEATEGVGTVSWGDVPADEVPLTEGLLVEGGYLTNALALAGQVKDGGEGGFDPLSAQIELAP